MKKHDFNQKINTIESRLAEIEGKINTLGKMTAIIIDRMNIIQAEMLELLKLSKPTTGLVGLNGEAIRKESNK